MLPRSRWIVAATLLAALLASRPAHGSASTPLHVLPSDSTGGPPVAWWQILPHAPCAGDSVRLEIRWCPGCATLVSAEWTNDRGLVVEFQVPQDFACDRCITESRVFELGRFAAGFHVFAFHFVQHIMDGNIEIRTEDELVRVPFTVLPPCGTGDGLTFVDRVAIAGTQRPDVCEGDSIRVKLSGHFGDNCHSVRRVELFWLTYANGQIRPGPPAVRVLVDDGGCLGRPCVYDTVAWSAEITMPPLPEGPYQLPVWEYLVTCADTFPPDPSDVAHVPFRVKSHGECDGREPCFVARFPYNPNGCDALVGPGRPARLTLQVMSATALAGLQGDLRLSPQGLRITAIETVGPAAGMNLTWRPTPQGASFVLFATHGAPIPAMPPDWLSNDGVPVLRVTLEVASGQGIPAVSRLAATELIASDSLGRGVPLCPIPVPGTYEPRLDRAARICADRPCDANGDGQSDVRDLVSMVRCLYEPCADSARFDCNRDGQFALDDVICCALTIVRNGAPPDSNAVAPPTEVSARLESPRRDGMRVHIPVRVRGLHLLSGAMLRLRFPTDRYAFAGVSLSSAWPEIMELHSLEGSDLALGFMNLATLDGAAGPPHARASGELVSELVFDVALDLKPGATPDGDMELLDGQFASIAGQRYAVQVTPAGVPLAPITSIELSSLQPNPFSRETRFSVDNPQSGAADVAVLDLSGRRVATLFRGTLAAGRTVFRWSGDTDRGGRAASGVYFVQVRAGGNVAARKVVVVQGP